MSITTREWLDPGIIYADENKTIQAILEFINTPTIQEDAQAPTDAVNLRTLEAAIPASLWFKSAGTIIDRAIPSSFSRDQTGAFGAGNLGASFGAYVGDRILVRGCNDTNFFLRNTSGSVVTANTLYAELSQGSGAEINFSQAGGGLYAPAIPFGNNFEINPQDWVGISTSDPDVLSRLETLDNWDLIENGPYELTDTGYVRDADYSALELENQGKLIFIRDEGALLYHDGVLWQRIGEAYTDTEIAIEAQARELADESLQTAIDTEAQARELADESLQTAIDTEAQTREDADQALQTAIDSEAQTREFTDTVLQSQIDSEKLERQDDDRSLQANIEAERQARELAITQAISQMETYTNNRTDASLAGVDWRADVRVCYRGENFVSVTPSGLFMADSVQLQDGDIYLYAPAIVDFTPDNTAIYSPVASLYGGFWVARTGAHERPTISNQGPLLAWEVGTDVRNWTTQVREGTLWKDKSFHVISDSAIVGTDAIEIKQFVTGSETTTDGGAVTQQGNVLGFNPAALEVGAADEVESANLKLTYTAQNYTPTATTAGGHVAGIDAKLKDHDDALAVNLKPINVLFVRSAMNAIANGQPYQIDLSSGMGANKQLASSKDALAELDIDGAPKRLSYGAGRFTFSGSAIVVDGAIVDLVRAQANRLVSDVASIAFVYIEPV